MRNTDFVPSGRWPVAKTYVWNRGRRAHVEDSQELARANGGVELYLRAGDASREPDTLRAEPPSLFRILAELEPTTNSVFTFAQRYGSLGLWEAFVDQDSGLTAYGDSLASWRAEILAMRHVVAVWDALCDPAHSINKRLLQNRFRHHDFKSGLEGYLGAKYLPGEPVPKCAFRRMLTSDSSWAALEHVSHADLQHEVTSFSYEIFETGFLKLGSAERQRRLARAFVQTVITDRLTLWVRPALVHMNQPRLRLSPVAFAGALWLQLASSIEGGFRYRRCGSCGAWIEISPSVRGRGQRAEYCRDTCRVRAWRTHTRLRRARGRQLAKA